MLDIMNKYYKYFVYTFQAIHTILEEIMNMQVYLTRYKK